VVARSAKAPRTRPLMKLYLDTSALVKLVSTADADGIDPPGVTTGPAAAIAYAPRLRTRLDIVALTIRLLDVAAVLPPAEHRTLDAIDLAAAQTAPDLRALVTYDDRMADAAAQAGVVVAQPA
jgi:hypothetical protein